MKLLFVMIVPKYLNCSTLQMIITYHYVVILYCMLVSTKYLALAFTFRLAVPRTDFRVFVKLDGKKITSLFSLTPKLNLAFHSIINVGNKASRLQKCLLTSLNLTTSILCIEIIFFLTRDTYVSPTLK
jgi:hypothetical protein